MQERGQKNKVTWSLDLAQDLLDNPPSQKLQALIINFPKLYLYSICSIKDFTHLFQNNQFACEMLPGYFVAAEISDRGRQFDSFWRPQVADQLRVLLHDMWFVI